MEWLNYHHLLYFWTVARTGSITKAAKELLLAPPTISAQVSRLEDSLGEKLFARSGRRLILTEVGEVVFRYAQDIFSLGRELRDALKGFPTSHPMRLVVGVADVLPKGVIYRLVEPALQLGLPVHLVCREDPFDRLLALLALQEVDLVLSDAPIGPEIKIRAFNHLLGECGITFLGPHGLPAAYRQRFPLSLHGAPMLLPTDNTAIRRSLDEWFDSNGIQPQIAGEFEDDALLREFAKAGAGLFPTPSVFERDLLRSYNFQRIGRTQAVRARFYAISIERKIKHPAVVAICETARRELFR